MSSDYFKSALESVLKPQTRRQLVKILIVIRKNVEGHHRKANIRKVYEKGCLKQLVANLQQPHLDILNLTLSILGNCCLDKDCARESVNMYNLLPYINSVLEHYKQDSIQGRIFRIIGNICQHPDSLTSIIIEKEPHLHLVSKIVACLTTYASTDDAAENAEPTAEEVAANSKNKTSSATLIMALRALKELICGTYAPLLIRTCNMIQAIGMLVLKLAPSWKTSSQCKDILHLVLKLLYEYLKRFASYDAVVQLQNTDKGNAVEPLGKLVTFSPFMVIQILNNLCEVTLNNRDLPIVDIIKTLEDELKDLNNFKNGREDPQYRDYLKCLCFLVLHPSTGNLSEDNFNDRFVPILLTILRGYSDPTCIAIKNCMLIVSTLKSRYRYNSVKLKSMLHNDIIDILVEKLHWILGKEYFLNLEHECKYENVKDFDQRKKIVTEPRLATSCNRWACLSQTFSPPASPVFSLSDTDGYPDDDEFNSDHYSPVCSEDEEECTLSPMEDFGAKMEQEISTYSKASLLNPIDKEEILLRKQFSHQIVKLIRTFALMKPPPTELNSPTLLIKLLQYFMPSNVFVRPNDMEEIVMSITENHEYLIGIMQSNVIFELSKFLNFAHGSQCVTCINLHSTGTKILGTLSKIVNVGCGGGDIAHQLYRASLPVKEKLVASIPFITSKKNVLHNLMITCGGLNILLELLQEKSKIQCQSIYGLCVLAKSLGIKNPKYHSCRDSKKIVELSVNIEQYKVKANCSTVVRFKLDDGTCVEADREFLSQKSDYFNRLLCGDFKESWEEEIRLHNVSSESLKCLLLLLQYNLNSTVTYVLDLDVQVMLDVISLTHHYLMSDLCLCITTSVQYFKLHYNTVASIYNWALESRTNLLRIEVIAFALVENVDMCKRYYMFQKLLQLDYCEDVFDDIKNLLNQSLGGT